MSALEKRLRELCDEYGLTERHGFAWAVPLARRAAAIGAEIEREECARLIDDEAPGFYDDEFAVSRLADAIRARGDK